MSGRTVLCDFCSTDLGGSAGAWDFPARDIDYGEPRVGPDSPEPIEGSIGSWLACDDCADLIRRGERGRLARRNVERLKRTDPDWIASIGFVAMLAETRDLHDRFWSAREGDGVPIGAEQLALIARDPALVREWRPGNAP